MDLEQIKVSVIVPVYNLQEYVESCINGLATQKTNFDFEIIVIDDCSTDNSWQLLQNLKQQYPDILNIYRNEKNQGIARTMALLVKKVQGKYVVYLDGDDIALQGKLQRQADYLDTHKNCSMVYHEMDVFDSETDQSLSRFVKDFYNYHYIPQHAGIEDLIRYSGFLHIGSVMLRNHPDLVNTADLHNKYILDYPWLVLNQCYLKGNIDFIDQTLGRYRVHQNSFCAKNRESKERRIQALDDLLHVCDLALNLGVDKNIVQQGKWHYYYAAALFFRKKDNEELFLEYIELSTDGEWFHNEKHREVWLNRNGLIIHSTQDNYP